MRGGFRGEWWTYSSFPVVPVLMLLAAFAGAVWLAAHLLLVGLFFGALIGLGAVAVFFLRRSVDRDGDREMLGARAAAVHAEAEQDRQLAAPKSLTVINVAAGAHVHLEGGAGAAGVISHAPVQGAVIRKESR